MDIGTEELSHLEVVGMPRPMHLKPMKFDREVAEADPLIAIAGGGGVNLFNSQGNPWTADYLKITGELDVDLRSNIAAEARAKIVYERLINFCDDSGHQGRAAVPDDPRNHSHEGVLRSAGKHEKAGILDRKIAPTPGLVNQYFNDSTGTGDEGEIDTEVRGTRAATGSSWPPRPCRPPTPTKRLAIRTESSPPMAPEGISELLVDELKTYSMRRSSSPKRFPKWRRPHGSTACGSALRST